MRQRKSNNGADVLPSLLDRLADNDGMRQRLDRLQKHIAKLDQQIRETSKDDTHTLASLHLELRTLHAEHEVLTRNSRSLERLEDCVKRDLSWLFNTTNLCLDEDEQNSFDEIKSSVLNYGLPDLTGKTASSINIRELEKILRQTILNFEPRLNPKKLKVVLHADDSLMNHNSLVFEISGELLTQPYPTHLHFLTTLDLESGDAEVKAA